tara:strand:- start:4099 stop:4818 length:720 start_codon:yes stop_codon:yes gene_type:complete
MQLSGLPTTLTKEFNKPESEVLAYILNKPKTFKEYGNEDRQKLGAYLVGISEYLGIKGILGGDHCRALVNVLCEEMPTFTLEELSKAIKMASMGKFEDVDTNHYQHLSPQYLSAMINAYKKHRGNIYQKYQRLQERIRREKEPEKVSKKDMFYLGLDLLDNEYNDYIVNTEQYCDTEYRNTQFKHIYAFLLQHKLIGVTNYDDMDGLKTYIISWFNAISKKDTTPRTYICNKFNIPLHS